ncbi:DegT/DnrJ/EryC1/StrS family aminotransferase [Marinimicrobium agarilyticum]|uniref:DegT/DnrJ/EryC1/StrS family aminotransferase n=1 Tax=Marinimicrobium agarilyticum TaxID=306546 RepID=UPI0004266455|nr:DegT/DnrJ/EryC1/StrS family aminotransferase [Marinimicrobium agarilyticum]
MDPVRSLIRGVLPPTGNRIALSVEGGPALERRAAQSLFPGKVLSWVDSGTSALALALLDIRHRRQAVPAPEVIIPAYCCPDLVSAAFYAGFTPVICDLAQNSCHYDQKALKNALSNNTLAIIAVNFLGLPESIDSIRRIVNPKLTAIIEDNAQWFPNRPGAQRTTSDYQTFSFGRGKPVNLLGGGLMVSNTSPPLETARRASSFTKRCLYYGKCAAYNALLRPSLYQALARNPLFKLGETRYHEHLAIRALPAGQSKLLTANIQTYWSHERVAEKRYRTRLSTINALSSLIDASNERLLRYPLLVESQKTRDTLIQKLNEEGLGSTKLYGDTIDRVDGVLTDRLRKAGGKTNAASFAQRFLTLPLHEGVKQHHIDRTVAIIESVVTPTE